MSVTDEMLTQVIENMYASDMSFEETMAVVDRYCKAISDSPEEVKEKPYVLAELTSDELKLYHDWREQVITPRYGTYFGAIGGEITFEITPTSIGTIIEAVFTHQGLFGRKVREVLTIREL